MASWNSPRRENITSAFKKAYADVGSTFTLEKIHERAQFYLERKIGSVKTLNALYASDAVYNRDLEVWVKPESI